jgi:hypothetical protein
MATTRLLLLRSQQTLTLNLTKPNLLRSFSAAPPNHEFLFPHDFLNSWTTPTDPKQAEAKLALLRREYAKKVKAYRKEYIQEVELQRLEKQRKDEAKREAMRIANEERRAAKVASKKAKAAEREVAEEEFRQTLLKERAAKLEYWRMREKHIQEKKKDERELLRRKSSVWVDEAELEKKLLAVIVDINPL